MKVITRDFLDKDYINLYPIADVHYGAIECMEREIKQYIKEIEADTNGAVVICGDLINNGIKSSVTNVYDEQYSPKQQKYDMIEMLKPIKDKIIAGVRGNHEYRVVKETSFDIAEDIFRELGISERYAGDAGFIKISVGSKIKNGKPATYMIYLSHGSGGGQLLGSGLSKQDNYQMTIEGIDISITAHTHKPVKAPSARQVFDSRNNNVINSNTLIFVCTAWMNYGGYAERKQMRPGAFYKQQIWLNGKAKEWR